MEQRLRQVLGSREVRHIRDQSRQLSAILVPIYIKQGEYHLVFTKRTEQVREHKGQISFPGGACQEGDSTLLNTALRECAEEIGLAAGDVEVLGVLDDVITQTSSYIIAPFVALIPWPYEFRVNTEEIEQIIEVPISALLDNDCLREESEKVNGETVTCYFYQYQGRVIWGATARILNQFLDIFAQTVKGSSNENATLPPSV